jgi:transposase-like protein
VIDVLLSTRRDAAAARKLFTRALPLGPAPVEITTDRAPAYPRLIDKLVPAAGHVTEQYAHNAVEADHARFKVNRPGFGRGSRYLFPAPTGTALA